MWFWPSVVSLRWSRLNNKRFNCVSLWLIARATSWPFHTSLLFLFHFEHTSLSWFSIRSADMCLCFTSQRLLLRGSHFFHNATPQTTQLSLCVSELSPFDIPFIPHGPVGSPHPASKSNHHCTVMNNLQHMPISEVKWNLRPVCCVCCVFRLQRCEGACPPPQYVPHLQPHLSSPLFSSPRELSFGVAMCPWLPWQIALNPTKSQSKLGWTYTCTISLSLLPYSQKLLSFT